jgi:hypothetical protein
MKKENPRTLDLAALLRSAAEEFAQEVLDSLDDQPVIDPETGAPAKLNALQAVVQVLYDRDRSRLVETLPFGTDSLTGSYFRAPDPADPSAEAAWLEDGSGQVVKGQVIGQPFITSSTTMYLVEFYGENGMTGHQQLVDIYRMMMQRWSFFDDEAWLDAGHATVEAKDRAES